MKHRINCAGMVFYIKPVTRIFSISINDFAKMVIDISGKNIAIKNIPGPTGVRGRNSDNRLFREKLGWEPSLPLRKGMEITYKWISQLVQEKVSVI